MKKSNIIILISVLLLSITLPLISLANSAMPPYFTVIVEHPPKELKLFIKSSDNPDKLIELDERIRDDFYIKYMLYNYKDSKEIHKKDIYLVATYENTGFELIIPDGLFQSHGLIFLDIKTQQINEYGSFLYIIYRIWWQVLLTLLIEGIVFFFLKYRKILSWIIFIIINLCTQTLLFFISYFNFMNNWIISFIMAEILICLIEASIYYLLLREKSKKQAIITAFAANILSLILGMLAGIILIMGFIIYWNILMRFV